MGSRWRSTGSIAKIFVDERIVSTEVYEGLPDGRDGRAGGNREHGELRRDEGRTTLSLLIQATNRVTRDAIIESGMEAGLQDALSLLEEVSRSIA